MITQHKATRKRVQQLVDAAERLAAVQYEWGRSDPAKQQVKRKVDRCWEEFRVACNAVLTDHQEIPTILVKWSR